jgi:hypothetical protein
MTTILSVGVGMVGFVAFHNSSLSSVLVQGVLYHKRLKTNQRVVSKILIDS